MAYGSVKCYLESDSSWLDITRSYKLFIKKKEKYIPLNRDVYSIWSLLDEYNEIPKKNFFLSFEYQTYYSESTTKRLTHFVDYYYDNIEITIPNDNYRAVYNYNR